MQIALISDTHLADVAGDFVANAVAACAWIDGSGADLAVHLGDITADGVLDPAHFDTARRVFAGLRTPLHLVPGNHDIGDRPPAGPSPHPEPTVTPAALAVYRETFGPDRWRLEAGGWTIVALNAQLIGLGDTEERAQFDWLDQVLRQVAGPVGVMLHKPLFRTGPEDGDAHPRYAPPASRGPLLRLLYACDLRFVVNGHTHQARRLLHEGVEHVWVPSTAFTIPDRLQERIGEKVVGTAMLTLEPNRHRFALASPPGILPYDLGDYAHVYPRIGHTD
jgi:3',5'-cyclic AMP phosphodiesterase CpdA